MAQPFLTMRFQSTTHAQNAVFQEIDGVLVQVGSDFGTIERTVVATNFETIGYNRVVNWFNNLYAVVGDGIWKFDTSTNGPWTQIHTFLTAVASDGELLGLMPCEESGEPILVTAYPESAADAIFVHMDANEVVTETPAIPILSSIFTSSPNWMTPIYHRGKIHWTVHSFSNQTARPYVLSYDIANKSVSNVFVPHYMAKGQLCIHNNRKYMALIEASRTTLRLFEVGTSSSKAIVTLRTNTNHYNDRTGYVGQALASIDGHLVMIGQSMTTTNGIGTMSFCAYSILLDDDGALIEFTDITSAINPGVPISSASHWLYNFRADTISTPGTTIYDIEHCLNTNEGTSTTNYRWNGSGNLMTNLGPGKNAWQTSRTYISEGSSGARVWHGSGTIQVSAPTMTLNGSDVDIDFEVYGANIPGVVLGVLFDKNGEACETKGTITQTDVGVIDNGFASGITATPNGTSVSIKWNAASNGIANGDIPKVTGRVFLP